MSSFDIAMHQFLEAAAKLDSNEWMAHSYAEFSTSPEYIDWRLHEHFFLSALPVHACAAQYHLWVK